MALNDIDRIIKNRITKKKRSLTCKTIEDLSIIPDLEIKGRKVFSELERGFELETKKECQEWLKVLEEH
ncbi:hypothetical protein JNUCC74_07040 [Cerasibacillus sp. JNUCC 74]